MLRVPFSNGDIRADWWTEEVDAVVVATGSHEEPWVPNIPNLDKCAKVFPEQIYHSREYRTPSGLEGKVSFHSAINTHVSCSTCIYQNVLIVGGSISAYGIALELLPSVYSVSLSVRVSEASSLLFRLFGWNLVTLQDHPLKKTVRSFFLGRLPANITVVPEIKRFPVPSSNVNDVRDLQISLVNGSTISGYDHVRVYHQSVPTGRILTYTGDGH